MNDGGSSPRDDEDEDEDKDEDKDKDEDIDIPGLALTRANPSAQVVIT